MRTLFLALLSSYCLLVSAITIDEGQIFLREPPSNHMDEEYDLFGYSAALHLTQTPASLNNARLLIGVPNGTTLDGQVERPGYVLGCPLHGSEPCSPLTSNSGEDPLYYKGSASHTKEQFLGFSMDSLNGKFAVCGHKWKFQARDENGKQRTFPHGVCHIARDPSLMDFDEFHPCSTDSRLYITTNVEKLGYCTAGVDISFLEDGTLAIGAPGAYEWQGAAILYSGLDDDNPVIQLRSQYIKDYDYAGMSVKRGHITSQSELQWILSAPRAQNYHGKVFIMGTDDSGRTKTITELIGPKPIASYYGYSIAAVDFDSDGFDDVLVGAPLYFGSSGTPEIGAVYVYNNEVEGSVGAISNEERSIIRGTISYGRFGHAIAPLGDLDNDGYPDVAISAPFGNDPLVSGTVYIYRGSLQGMIRQPSQTIVGSNLNLLSDKLAHLTSFGAYLSGSTDIDGNTYNDLLIGAFGSRKVFVMRARTVLTFEGNITAPETVVIKLDKHCESDGSVNNCFQIEYCVQLRGKGFANNQRIDFRYILYADKRKNGLQARATFNSTGREFYNGHSSGFINAPPNCFKQTIYIDVENPYDIQNIPLNPAFEVSIPPIESPNAGNGSGTFDDLTKERLFVQTQGVFNKQVVGASECQNQSCDADLEITFIPVEYRLSNNSLSQENVIYIGSLNNLIFETTLTNNGPNVAYAVLFKVIHPDSLTFSKVEEGDFTCTSTINITKCDIATSFNPSDYVKIRLRFFVNGKKLTGNEGSLNVEALASSAENDTNLSNNKVKYNITVQSSINAAVTVSLSRDQLTFDSNSPHSGRPSSLTNIGQFVQINFTVVNNGFSTIPLGELKVALPWRHPCNQKNQFIFYISDIREDHSLTCSQNLSQIVNPLKLTLDNRELREDEVPNLHKIDGICLQNTSTYACDENGDMDDLFGCAILRCDVKYLRSRNSKTLSINGYIDESYFSTVSRDQHLRFNAEFLVRDEFMDQDITDNHAEVELHLRYVITGGKPFEDWWIIAVSIVAALIIIVAAIIVLWACGFFKRKQRKSQQETVQSNENEEPTVTADQMHVHKEPLKSAESI